MGQLTANQDKLDFLTKEEQAEFNLIGYTGKNSNGVKMGRVEYLNSLRPKQERFQICQVGYDRGDFIEEFVLTRVIIPQTKEKTLAQVLFTSETYEELKRELEGETDEEIKRDLQTIPNSVYFT